MIVLGLWGEFNVVQSASEISGGHAQLQRAIDTFNLGLLDCGLENAWFVGSPFTWSNGHTWRQLDKVVSNTHWYNFFSLFWVTHLNRMASDHSPLLLSCDKNVARGPSMLKFLGLFWYLVLR